MRSGAVGLAACVTLGVVTVGAVPAGGVTQLKPRAGNYIGHETFGDNPLPVSFTVSRDRTRVVDFRGQAAAREGCTNRITSFQAPTGPMPISAAGRFSDTSTNYPQRGVRVKVIGRFISRIRVRGHIRVRIAKMPACTASRLFTARRIRPAASQGGSPRS
jgi:hypothetical protein